MPRLLQAPVDAAIFQLPDQCADLIFTSPPYWPSPDYPIPPSRWADGWQGRLGQEPTCRQYALHLREILHRAHRLLKPDGLLWLVLGRSYSEQGCFDVPAQVIVSLVDDVRKDWYLVDHLAWRHDEYTAKKEDSLLIFAPHPRPTLTTYGNVPALKIQVGDWLTFPPMLASYAMQWGPAKGTLLDPFCGSGQALRAAQDRGWDWLGVDLDLKGLALAAQALHFPPEQIEVL